MRRPENYIEVKYAMWQRLYFTDEADMKEKVKLLEEGKQMITLLLEEDGYEDFEEMYDTEEVIKPENNNGEATIEVYEAKKLIWKNAK